MAVTARRLPDRDPAVYVLESDGDVVTWFRYDDGWRVLPRGPGTTVDVEWLVSPKDAAELESELGLEAGGLVAVLDAARAEPWEPFSPIEVEGGVIVQGHHRAAALDALTAEEGPER